MVDSLRQVKGQHAALEQALQEINKELKVEQLNVLECIKKLPKGQDMADLQAQIECLLRKNAELKTQVVEKEARLKEVEELKSRTEAMEVELATAPKERDETTTLNRIF